MNRQITTVSTKGQFVIPSAMRSALGIKPGTRIAVTQEASRIVLEPVSEDLVDRTRGMLAGGPSLSKSLLRERRRAKDRW
ncbi:MAG: AbrB/MazE/SpoVT family DNA-binding domain-containing protein [Candidatus Sulfotelmatobacter sp.]|jgi:AbrB family looped-hinge helix DNA binding protein